jgi:hypothetical protein
MRLLRFPEGDKPHHHANPSSKNKAVVAFDHMTTYNAADNPPGRKVFFMYEA